ncbi:MAG: hypothetical protein VW397_03215 [Candidatus Margulisiibacteriota bacterium]
MKNCIIAYCSTDQIYSPVNTEDCEKNKRLAKQSVGICNANLLCFAINSEHVLIPKHCIEKTKKFNINFPMLKTEVSASLLFKGNLDFAILKLSRSINIPETPLQTERALLKAQQLSIRENTPILTNYNEIVSQHMTLASFMDGEGVEALTQCGDCGSIRIDDRTGRIYAFHIGKLNAPNLQTKHPTGTLIADVVLELRKNIPSLFEMISLNLSQTSTLSMDASSLPTSQNNVDLERPLPKYIQQLMENLNQPNPNQILDNHRNWDPETENIESYQCFIKNLRLDTTTAYRENKLGVIFSFGGIPFVIHTGCNDELFYIVGMKTNEEENPWRSFLETDYAKNKTTFNFLKFKFSKSKFSKWEPGKKGVDNHPKTDITNEIDTRKDDKPEYISMLGLYIAEAIRFDFIYELCQESITNEFKNINWPEIHNSVVKNWMNMIKSREIPPSHKRRKPCKEPVKINVTNPISNIELEHYLNKPTKEIKRFKSES